MPNSPRMYSDGRVTLADIAKLSGISRRTLSNWQTTRPQAIKALELAVKANRFIKSI